MSTRLSLLAVAALAHAAGRGDAQEPTSSPALAPTTQLVPRLAPPAALEEGEPPPRGDKRIGPRLGLAVGALSGVAPGGVRAGAALIWRIDREVWLDVEGAVRFGGGGAACYTGRGDERPLSCEHGVFDGTALEALVGGRVPLTSWPGGLEPYVRGGLGLTVITFPDDDVAGFSLPLWGGVGGRYVVSPGVGIVAEGTFTLGPGWFDGLGVEPIASLIIQGGVELDL